MRKKITILTMCAFTASTFGQERTGEKEFNENGSISFLSFERRDKLPSFEDIPTIFKDSIGITGDHRLVLRYMEKDVVGFEHRFYDQYFKNIRVEYGGYSVHLKDGNINYVTGIFQPVEQKGADFTLTEEDAFAAALRIIGAKSYSWETANQSQLLGANTWSHPKGERTMIRDIAKGGDEYRPAYKFSIYASYPHSNKIYYIDAHDGHLLYAEDLIKHAVTMADSGKGFHFKPPFNLNYFANATGTAATRYSGSQEFITDSYSGGFRLRESRGGVDIQTLNMLNQGGNYGGAYDFTDQDNNWTAAEHNNATEDNVALDAHWGAEKVFDYFKNVHVRNSWNNQRSPILNYVHANLTSMGYSSNDNAFWDGQRMTYGDGGSSFYPLTSLDVVAHEIGHGVMSSSANLAYRNESGALNEGISDIWAAAIENAYAPTKKNWEIGEDISIWGPPLRSMNAPKTGGMTFQPDTYGGTYWYQVSGCTPSGQNDQCGVHTNSGVLNYWFYLLVSGGSGTNDLGNAYSLSGIGMQNASKIVYRAITLIITNQEATFAVARTATIQAAKDLFGAGSCQEIAVTAAWHAVGVGIAYPANLTISGATSACSGQTYSTGDSGTIWSVTTLAGSGCTLSTISGSSVTLNFSLPGKALLKATKTVCGVQTSVSKEIYYGAPLKSLLAVRGSSSLSSPNEPGYYGIKYDSQNTCGGMNKAGISNIQWEVYPSASNIQEGSMACAMDFPAGGGKTIFFGSPGTKYLKVRAQNSCGWSDWTDSASFTVNVAGGMFAYKFYPNPADEEINIYYTGEKFSETPFQAALFDTRGNEVGSGRSAGGTIRLKTKHLKAGIYFLHYGPERKMEKKQIIIEH